MKHSEHIRRELIFLISLLLVFGLIFLKTIIDLHRGIPVLGIGLDASIENWGILLLSFLAILKTFFTIINTDLY